LINRRTAALPPQEIEEIQMQKADLYEAILLVNRGIDEAVRGLERLKRAKDSGLDPACFDEKVTLFEIHRASLNGYFCNNVERSEYRDAARFERKHCEYEKNALDEIQVYQDLRAVEERRRMEGKPPKVRFFTEQEQQEWERQYPTSPEGVGGEAPHGTGGQP
jgi:DNA polymerase III delta prime subunit